jgi:hypothetical protein
VNALADDRVAEYFNETFVCTYLRVGKFEIVGKDKVGGNVASYFCTYDGGVVHAVPGKTDAETILREARWAYEVRKAARTAAAKLGTAELDMKKFTEKIRAAHVERYWSEVNPWHGAQNSPLPMYLPKNRSQQTQAHWLLGRNPLGKLDHIYPIVWRDILGEKLSSLPVGKQ